MKYSNELKYFDFGRFVVRCPSLPFKYDDKFFLKEIITNDFFMEALYIASPDLHDEILKIKEFEIIGDRLKFTLIKYWNRIRTRSTPFGIFSGTAIGSIDNNTTSLVLSNNYNRIVRLDMTYLYSLIDDLKQKDEIIHTLKYFVNDSLYKVGNQIRYYRIVLDEKKTKFNYEIISIASSSYLNKIIKKAEHGIKFSEMLRCFGSEFSEDEISNYLKELIDSQILISELSPTLTGDGLERIINLIDQTVLNSLHDNLEKINKLIKSPTKNKDVYVEIEQIVKEINSSYNRNNLIQVDLKRSFKESCIDQVTINEIKEAIVFLNSIDNPIIENQNLNEFRSSYNQLYEDQELSLLQVLDSEAGIGYPVKNYGEKYLNSLIKNFELPTLEKKEENFLVLKNLIVNQKSFVNEINLENEKIEFKSKSVNNFYPVFYTCFEFIDLKGVSVPRIKYIGDNSGVKLLTRFSQVDDEIRILVDDVINKEKEFRENILAEIIHLPSPRLGNISHKHSIRDFEITCLTFSDRDVKYKIPISDLMISISQNKVILRSKKLNKIVEPILTTAHNYVLSNLPVYTFLGDLQFQNEKNIFFPLDFNLRYTPRLRYKNVLLSLATWKFRSKELSGFYDLSSNILLAAFREWRAINKIPEMFLFCQYDNELLIDTKDIDNIKIFLKEIKSTDMVKITEFLFNDKNSLLRDEHGNFYRQEIILPLYSSEK